MTFQDPNAFYEEELLLLVKGIEIPTTVTEGQVIDGDLTPFRHRMEAVNTGNQLQNNGILLLRVPPDGTFVRKEPILIDESAKDDYIIQFQIKQDRDKDGVFEEEGKLFRFFIGQPTLQDDEHIGETLRITLIPTEYRTRETLDSRLLRLKNPKDAFQDRATFYNTIKGQDNTQILLPVGDNKLSDAEALKQTWQPLAPQPTHDLFREIVSRQSVAGVQGGVFEDFFFDYDASTVSTNAVNLKVEAEGTIDRGVILDPLLFETSDTEKDKTINVDLIKFKNNVIVQGNPLGGSLPREHSVFSSLFEHAKARPEWEFNRQYFDGTAGTNQSEVRIEDGQVLEIRFFKAIKTTGNFNVNPIGGGNAEEFWEEDFVTVPEYNNFASYNEDDIITALDFFPNDTTGRFYKAKKDVPNDPKNIGNERPAVGGTTFWAEIGERFSLGEKHPLIDTTANTGLLRTGRTQFFSYSPWTSNFNTMRAGTLFGIRDSTAQQSFVDCGYQGVIPDWNLSRANFDRVVADDRFEQVVGKDVIDTLSDEPSIEERYLGARFLVSPAPTGEFVGQANRIAEWNGSSDFKVTSVGDWKFSNFPQTNETIIHQGRGVWLVWDGNAWDELWNICRPFTVGVKESVTTQIANLVREGAKAIFDPFRFVFGGIISLLYDKREFDDTTRHAPLHICKDIKLVEGSSGIPGQAFELRFEWNALEELRISPLVTIPLPNASKRNFSSIGAWWYLPFPIPKFATPNESIGDISKNGSLDANNLDFDHKHKIGWNNGIDSEDLGRIQQVSFKARLSLFGSLTAGLVVGFSDMPMVFWARDIFDRVWFAKFKLRRNGEYSLIRISFGENAIQNLHHARYDELIELFGIVLDINWFLKEKEFTGIEFDWRFVKSMGMFYEIGYNSEGLYIANQMIDYVKNVATQAFSQIFPFLVSVLFPGEDFQANDFLVNNARLAIDEFRFDKQLYTNSDDISVPDARTVLDHQAQEVDYINAKITAQASKARKLFVEQAWFMKAHGDVRLRFGEKFIARGPRVPNPLGEQDLICNEVKHIIDSDGYMIELTGKRKFIF